MGRVLQLRSVIHMFSIDSIIGNGLLGAFVL